jgi:fructose-bisphosphate aldolase, class II
MKQTYGVPLGMIVHGIRHGVRKVNIDTDLRLAAVAEIRRVATQERSEVDPRKFFGPVKDAMSRICRERFEAFGTAGHASRIRVIPTGDMAKRYASGTLQ